MHRRILTNAIWGSPSGTPAVLFDSVSGVSFRADVVPPFRTYGIRVRRLGPITLGAYEAIGAWIDDLQRLSDRVLSAVVACSVWRPHAEGRFSRHPMGQAIDIAGVWWDRCDGVSACRYGMRRRVAVGIEATMRLHFGTVLGPTADRRHGDHWHCDVGRAPQITVHELAQSAKGTRKVEVVFLQEACTIVHGKRLKPDGVWGPKTMTAVGEVTSSIDGLSFEDITQSWAYAAFLTTTASMALSLTGVPRV
jgi:hypothetical protein